MNRSGILGAILWASLAACIGVGLFLIKYEVKDQERRLAALTAEINRNQETIHVLRAEWSYLNDPGRLRTLSEKHLGMRPVNATQVATLDQVLRDGLPATQLAAAPGRHAQPAAAQSARLIEGPPRPRPSLEAAKPPPKPTPPPKPGTVTLAKSPPPSPPAASPVPDGMPAPSAPSAMAPSAPSAMAPSAPSAMAPSAPLAKAPPAAAGGARPIVIMSPALAQGGEGGR